MLAGYVDTTWNPTAKKEGWVSIGLHGHSLVGEYSYRAGALSTGKWLVAHPEGAAPGLRWYS